MPHETSKPSAAAAHPVEVDSPYGLRGPRSRQAITTQGLIFASMTLIIGFASINTGNNLSYLFFSVMLSFLIVSGLMALKAMQGLEIDRVVPRHIHAGELCAVTLIVTNRKRHISSYSLRVVDVLEDGSIAGAGYMLRAEKGDKTECSYQTRFTRRGVYRLAAVRVVSSYPFGLFRRMVEIPCRRELLVYPPALPFRVWAAWSPVQIGRTETPQKGAGTDLYGLREYQPGDEARFIHWKISARTRQLVTREFEREEVKKITLLLDNGVPDPDDEGLGLLFEKAVVAAASLAGAFAEREHDIQLITRSGRVPMASGHSHLLRMLRSLAQVRLVEYEGRPLWIPPPSKDEAHVAIRFAPGAPPRAANVENLVVQDTPPFNEFEIPETPIEAPAG